MHSPWHHHLLLLFCYSVRNCLCNRELEIEFLCQEANNICRVETKKKKTKKQRKRPEGVSASAMASFGLYDASAATSIALIVCVLLMFNRCEYYLFYGMIN